MLTTAYYFLQVMLCSAVMMGYYLLVLRNKRFHQYNRFYLLFIAVFSWVVPFIKIQWNRPPADDQQVIRFLTVVADSNSELEATVEQGFQWNWDMAAAGIYFIVAGWLLVMIIKALVILYRLLKTHSCKSVGDVYLILTQAKGTPFSFFRYIFWNEAIDIRSEAGKQILQHELTHVRQKHSLDKLLIQLVLVAGWFNPFFWLLKKEMEMIHEFIADKKAVHNGDTASLAQMLLTAAYPQQKFALTHPFFFSPVKRRLQMLANNKNTRFSYLRRLIVLPLLAMVVVLFAFRSTNSIQPISVGGVVETVVNSITAENNNTIAENNGTAAVLHKAVNLSKTYTVVVNAGHGGTDIGARGADGTTEAQLTLAIAKLLKARNTNSNMNIILTREADVYHSVMDVADFANRQSADLFLSVHINNAPAVKKAGGQENENPKKGVELYIASKEKAVDYQANYRFANHIGNAVSGIGSPFLGIRSGKAGIHVLQAVKCPSVLIECGFMNNSDELKKLKDPNRQQQLAIALLNGIQNYFAAEERTVVAGDIIEVENKGIEETKVSEGQQLRREGLLLKNFAAHQHPPLIIIDGKKADTIALKKLNPEELATVNILKGDKAMERYGPEGNNGVVEVVTKNISLALAEVQVEGIKPVERLQLQLSPENQPDDYKAFLTRNPDVKSASWGRNPSRIIIVLKDGTREIYELDNPASKKRAEHKYGALPVAPQVLPSVTLQLQSATLQSIDNQVQVPAEFPGGLAGWAKYLERNLNKDLPMKNGGPPGKYTVYVSFVVDKNGQLSDVRAENNPGYGTAGEAVRVIEKGPSWKPAMQNGKTVVYRHRLSITFIAPDTDRIKLILRGKAIEQTKQAVSTFQQKLDMARSGN